MTKQTVRLKCCDSGEIMVHWPSGRIQFMGWIAALKLTWGLLRRDVEIEIED